VNLLIVDDELSMRELLELVFHQEGYRVSTAESVSQAREILAAESVQLVISDMRLTDGNGLELLRHIRDNHPDTLFVLITAFASAESAIDALKFGAYDYITKPFDIDDLKKIVQNALRQPAVQKAPAGASPGGAAESTAIIGVSPEMIKIYKTIGVIAPTESTILLTGESGTGKEMIARAIHEASPRKHFPFVSINCGAFPETLLESELFGYQKGAFTGAAANKRGLFEVAHRGTLFLDEVAETTPAMQVKLLRALQGKRIRRLGGTEEITVDTRIIAATNKNLEERIREGSFREDLYYRIAVIPIHLPPLRDRREDIPALANYFLKRFNQKMSKSIQGVSPRAMERLIMGEWKGNVRELENVIERAVALETTELVQAERLPALGANAPPPTGALSVEITDAGFDIDAFLADAEKQIILRALAKAGGVQVEAARLLGITYRSFRHRMQKLGIEA
jgi:two-component system response regulator PilR (NtrC family)